MNPHEQITELEIKLLETTSKKKQLSEWLIRNFDSSDRLKIISDINEIDVSIQTLNFKIDNLLNSKPILGFEIEESTENGDNNNPKTNKQI